MKIWMRVEAIWAWLRFRPAHRSMIRVRSSEPCWMCQRPTHWIDLGFEARFCAPLCLGMAIGGYNESSRGSPR